MDWNAIASVFVESAMNNACIDVIKYNQSSGALNAQLVTKWVARVEDSRPRMGLLLDVFGKRRALSEALQTTGLSVVTRFRGVADEFVDPRDDHENERK